MNRNITINGVEPALLSLRHPRGINLDLNVTFSNQNGSPYPPSFPQIVFLPRSKGGALPFDMTVTDVVNGSTNVKVQGSALVDILGYGLELYMRRTPDFPGDPPTPTFLAAKGVLVTEGSAYAGAALSETILPTVMGPPGPPGPAGDPGATGVRGSIWFTAPGAPAGIAEAQTGDMYLDESNGDVYRFSNGLWTRGTF